MQFLFPQNQQQNEESRPVSITVPFLSHSLGLGDVIAGATQAIGIEPCEPCQKRKDALNRRFQLNPYRG